MNQIAAPDTIVKTPPVPFIDKISRKEFYNEFVKPGKPVVLQGFMDNWDALNWGADYFKANEGEMKLAIKKGNVAEGKREIMPLSEYVFKLERYEEELKKGKSPANPGYLHDVPFFHLYPKFTPDIEPFPVDLFPKWYSENWHNYIQFFMGATGSLTPLHFDTLCTNNLFFQVVGKKKFILIPEAQKDQCYMKGWRWADFDPSDPDFEKFPLAQEVTPVTVEIGPGDILFIPSGVLHQVHGLSYSISFNIDWHTPESARKGLASFFKGAPRKNIYYNFLLWLGVAMKVPAKHIFPYYKTYLNYVS